MNETSDDNISWEKCEKCQEYKTADYVGRMNDDITREILKRLNHIENHLQNSGTKKMKESLTEKICAFIKEICDEFDNVEIINGRYRVEYSREVAESEGQKILYGNKVIEYISIEKMGIIINEKIKKAIEESYAEGNEENNTKKFEWDVYWRNNDGET